MLSTHLHLTVSNWHFTISGDPRNREPSAQVSDALHKPTFISRFYYKFRQFSLCIWFRNTLYLLPSTIQQSITQYSSQSENCFRCWI